MGSKLLVDVRVFVSSCLALACDKCQGGLLGTVGILGVIGCQKRLRVGEQRLRGALGVRGNDSESCHLQSLGLVTPLLQDLTFAGCIILSLGPSPHELRFFHLSGKDTQPCLAGSGPLSG